MTAKIATSRARRAVALCAAPLAGLQAGAEAVRVASPYEAAAELLSGAVSALVVDLAKLPAEHVRLLLLAARKRVPVVAFGTITCALPTAAMLNVRLVGQGQVNQALRELLAGPVPPTGDQVLDLPAPRRAGASGAQGSAPAPPPTRAGAGPDAVQAQPPAPAKAVLRPGPAAPGKGSNDNRSGQEGQAAGDGPAPPAAPGTARPLQPDPPPQPAEVLTEEEMRALLKDFR